MQCMLSPGILSGAAAGEYGDAPSHRWEGSAATREAVPRRCDCLAVSLAWNTQNALWAALDGLEHPEHNRADGILAGERVRNVQVKALQPTAVGDPADSALDEARAHPG